MFRAPLDSFHLSDPDCPAWIDQVLSPESLRKTGYFDAAAVAKWRAAVPRMPRTLEADDGRDGPGGGDGHAVVAPPVHLGRFGGVADADQ